MDFTETIYINGVAVRCTPMTFGGSFFTEEWAVPGVLRRQHRVGEIMAKAMRRGHVIHTQGNSYSLHPEPN